MSSARFIVVKVTLHEREGGGLRVSSSSLPGLILSGADRQAVFDKIGPTIQVLLRRQGVQPVTVECATSVEEVLRKTPPCDLDMHVRSFATQDHEEEFVVELLQPA